MIINNVLKDFEGFRKYCDGLDYTGMTNPADGVFYPNVTDKIPSDVLEQVRGVIEEKLGGEVDFSAVFLRQSPEGVHCPHPVHTDTLMGEYAFMLYLNRKGDCQGGTSFVEHIDSGLREDPITMDQYDVWLKDYANNSKWRIHDMAYMMPNRGVLFNAKAMHRAEPVGGFGTTNEDARLVLTAFCTRK